MDLLYSLSLSIRLFEYSDQQAGNGYQNGSGTDPDGGAVADIGIASLGLVGGHVKDVVLLKIEIRGEHQVGIVQVQRLNLTLAVGILTNQFHIVAYSVYRHVAGHGQGFQHVYFSLVTVNVPGLFTSPNTDIL